MDEIEILKARLEFQKARIAELEKQNSEYLARLTETDKIIAKLNKLLEENLK